ncbi:HAMP domain-containing histidine kinase [candidate division TA06 bacterium]|nr:HAMP domain-containing histidine kinase [candidate division TA06 bacterium]
MKRNPWGVPGLLKGYLFLGALIIALGSFLYTQSLIRQLEEPVRILSRIIAEFYTKAGSSVSPQASLDTEIIFEEVIQKIDFPVIFTDDKGIPRTWRNVGMHLPQNSIEELEGVDPQNPPAGPIGKLFKIISRLDRKNPPIPIKVEGAGILGYVHYGEPKGVKILRWAPFIQLFVIALFALLGFIGFRTVRRAEENYIWLGMAKETAHQLGTPLSSLMGWIEVIRDKGGESKEALEEMEKDISRLQGITSRFSKIGSPPTYQEQDVLLLIREACQYFRGRLPRYGKKIQIIAPLNPLPSVKVDGEIFTWALENLIKNGIDAITEVEGRIEVTARSNGKWLEIRVKDSGRGVSREERRRIFRPGYSTKNFGWGLGLPLAKRIIETYHNGRLTLESSQLGEGSTFLMALPINR